MIDKYTDISVVGQLVVFAKIIEEYVHMIFFLALLHIVDGKKYVSIIFEG
jgi:hypothetical protein